VALRQSTHRQGNVSNLDIFKCPPVEKLDLYCSHGGALVLMDDARKERKKTVDNLL